MLSTDPLDAWIAHAERRLRGLALDLRRLPLVESTWRIHVRALELKSIVARWRKERPDAVARATLLDYVDVLTREVKRFRDRQDELPPTSSRFRQSVSAANGLMPQRVARPA